MGFAHIFWIREASIRDYIASNGRDEIMVREVGRQVLTLAQTLEHNRLHAIGALSFFESGDTFFPFRSFHSTDFAVLLWTGQRLSAISDVDTRGFDVLQQAGSSYGGSN